MKKIINKKNVSTLLPSLPSLPFCFFFFFCCCCFFHVSTLYLSIFSNVMKCHSPNLAIVGFTKMLAEFFSIFNEI